MRFLLVVAIWFIIVGGLYSYVTTRDAKRQQVSAAVVENVTVADLFSIELTPTFSTEKDPFALTTSSDEGSSLELRVNGATLPYSGGELQRGATVRFEGVEGMLAGQNEIYVKASPPLNESTLEHGIRVKLFRDSTLMVDETIWGEQGAIVVGSVGYRHKIEEEDHDH